MTVRLRRVAVKSRGIKKLMIDPRLIADIAARGGRVAAECEAAAIRVEGRPGKIDLPVTLQVNANAGRARARIILDHPAGQAVEAKHALLLRALDAAG